MLWRLLRHHAQQIRLCQFVNRTKYEWCERFARCRYFAQVANEALRKIRRAMRVDCRCKARRLEVGVFSCFKFKLCCANKFNQFIKQWIKCRNVHSVRFTVD